MGLVGLIMIREDDCKEIQQASSLSSNKGRSTGSLSTMPTPLVDVRAFPALVVTEEVSGAGACGDLTFVLPSLPPRKPRKGASDHRDNCHENIGRVLPKPISNVHSTKSDERADLPTNNPSIEPTLVRNGLLALR